MIYPLKHFQILTTFISRQIIKNLTLVVDKILNAAATNHEELVEEVFE
jgi:hypothetical protein